MAEDHTAEHHVLRQLQGLGLDHQHTGLGACDDQIQLTGLQFGRRRIEQIAAIRIADAAGGDRAIEGHTGHRQGCRRTDHRRDVGIHFRIQRQHLHDHLDFVVEAIGKQWSDRPIDQARGQDLLLRRPAFALEKATGDTAGGVELLDVIDGEREEILSRTGLLGGDDGREHHGLVDADDDCTVCLPGDLAGLHGDGLLAVRECLLDCGRQGISFSLLVGGATAGTDREVAHLWTPPKKQTGGSRSRLTPAALGPAARLS